MWCIRYQTWCFQFTLCLLASFTVADVPLTSGAFGTTARFFDEKKSSIVVPPNSDDTIICDPTMIDVVAKSGFGSGKGCLRFINNDPGGSNYLPFKANSIVSFVDYYLRDVNRQVCEVAKNPWAGWRGKPETQCGAQTFTQTNTCITPPFGCDDTCPWSPDGRYKITREITIPEGSCCDKDNFISETGLTERQTRASCFAPGKIAFVEMNQCGDVRKKTLDCMRCNNQVWSPENGLLPQEAAATCMQGNVLDFSWINECGGRKSEIISCTGCDPSVWTSTLGLPLKEAARDCPVGKRFNIVNSCGLQKTAPCTGV
ncbi:hypothetical protein N9V62_06985 [Porticoccaceae bacterium]|nr:hypothetical protein [Porticoccaceae bacterium]